MVPLFSIGDLTFYLSYAVWFGGSLMASLVGPPPLLVNGVSSFLVLSPSSTRSATPRRSTMRLVPAFAGGTKFSAAQRRDGGLDGLYKLERKKLLYFTMRARGRAPRKFTFFTRTSALINAGVANLGISSLPPKALPDNQLEQLHWNPSNFFSPIPQNRRSSFSSVLNSASSPSKSSRPHGSNGLHAI